MSYRAHLDIPEGKTLAEYFAELNAEKKRGDEEIERMIAACQELNTRKLERQMEITRMNIQREGLARRRAEFKELGERVMKQMDSMQKRVQDIQTFFAEEKLKALDRLKRVAAQREEALAKLEALKNDTAILEGKRAEVKKKTEEKLAQIADLEKDVMEHLTLDSGHSQDKLKEILNGCKNCDASAVLELHTILREDLIKDGMDLSPELQEPPAFLFNLAKRNSPNDKEAPQAMEVEAQSDPGPNSNASSGTVNDVFDLFQSPDPNRQKPTDKILPPFDEASFDTNQSFQLREMKDKMNQGLDALRSKPEPSSSSGFEMPKPSLLQPLSQELMDTSARPEYDLDDSYAEFIKIWKARRESQREPDRNDNKLNAPINEPVNNKPLEPKAKGERLRTIAEALAMAQKEAELESDLNKQAGGSMQVARQADDEKEKEKKHKHKKDEKKESDDPKEKMDKKKKAKKEKKEKRNKNEEAANRPAMVEFNQPIKPNPSILLNVSGQQSAMNPLHSERKGNKKEKSEKKAEATKRSVQSNQSSNIELNQPIQQNLALNPLDVFRQTSAVKPMHSEEKSNKKETVEKKVEATNRPVKPNQANNVQLNQPIQQKPVGQLQSLDPMDSSHVFHPPRDLKPLRSMPGSARRNFLGSARKDELEIEKKTQKKEKKEMHTSAGQPIEPNEPNWAIPAIPVQLKQPTWTNVSDEENSFFNFLKTDTTTKAEAKPSDKAKKAKKDKNNKEDKH